MRVQLAYYVVIALGGLLTLSGQVRRAVIGSVVRFFRGDIEAIRAAAEGEARQSQRDTIQALKDRLDAVEREVIRLKEERKEAAVRAVADDATITHLTRKLASTERRERELRAYVRTLVELMRAAGITVPSMQRRKETEHGT